MMLPEAKPPVAALSSAKVNVCRLELNANGDGADDRWSLSMTDGGGCCSGLSLAGILSVAALVAPRKLSRTDFHDDDDGFFIQEALRPDRIAGATRTKLLRRP